MASPKTGTVQLHNMYVADFETTDSQELYKIDHSTGEKIYKQRVWLAGHKNLATMESKYFTSLDDFMADILSRGSNTHREYGIHNLKFDGSYIIPWLYDNGYTVALAKPQPKEFSVLVDERNNWYNITIQVTKRRKVTIWDTVKLFPTALEYMPDIYSTPTKKIREDQDFYTKPRPEGYIPDDRDLAYFENDLQVPAETLNEHIKLYGLGFKKTQASQSYYNFEQVFKAWRLRFVALTTEVDETVRPAYWGGIAYVPKHKSGKDFYNLNVMDINSSYPHKAAEMKLPYGRPTHEYGEGKHPDMSKFWVAEAIVRFKLKSKDHLPCIPSKAISEGRPLEIDKWVDDSGNNGQAAIKMTFSNIDYMTIQESYDFEVIQWKWSIHWAWKKHREVAKFVLERYNTRLEMKKLIKEELEKDKPDQDKIKNWEIISYRAKIDINAFYGKFGEEVLKRGKTPYVEEDDEGNEEIVWRTDREDEATEYNRKFLPVAIAITAWGRQQLVKMANLLGEHFLYCDTDSVHYLREGQAKIDEAIERGEIIVDKTELGAWDFEGEYTRGRFLRGKCYMEEKPDGTIEATVAGLPADPHTGQFSKKRSVLNWDNFHIGLKISSDESNKLRSVRTPTGTKLMPVGFEIKEKDNMLGGTTEEKINKFYEQYMQNKMKEIDPIREAVHVHGFMRALKEGDLYYPDYKLLPLSVKRKYFRRNAAIALDDMATILNTDASGLLERLEG